MSLPTDPQPSENVAESSALLSWPLSTYRLQFHAGFTFNDAQKIVPYLHALGITHVYASPILTARPGSLHGYDVIDHQRLNPELGTIADFDAYVAALIAHGMQQVIDIVPNHMGVATNENAWWNDCLENGPDAKHGNYFDIAWREPARPDLHDKILLPTLGESYGETLQQGKLQLSFEDGGFFVRYYDRRFPLSPRSTARIIFHRVELLRNNENIDEASLKAFEQLAGESASGNFKDRVGSMLKANGAIRDFVAENIAIFNGIPGDPGSFDLLDGLLGEQYFRLAGWRTASDEINYRRFFDINDLAALRVERADVFTDSHALIIRLLAEGKIAGLRIDHPDGLYDPANYFLRLQNIAAGKDLDAAPDGNAPLYVVAEKILAVGEPLPEDWAVHGTTGYDYIAAVNGLFVDGIGAGAFTQNYSAWISNDRNFEQLCREKKRLILQTSLTGDLDMLAHAVSRLARRNRLWRDFTFNAIHTALLETIAVFPIYRTYASERDVSEQDVRIIKKAMHDVKDANADVDSSVYIFLQDVLLLHYPATFDDAARAEQRQVAGKFQQLTSPVTAKGIEDTAFYVYNRLVSLNEVGGNPGQFGTPAAALHEWFSDRQAMWPLSMSPLSTHDTKRSEDVRARLNVLSEFPEEWWQRVARWSRLNEPHRRSVEGTPAPDPNDEYLIYQTLVGAWPIEGSGQEPTANFLERICEYMQKALREAKVHSSWTKPNAAYETATMEFIRAILTKSKSEIFLQDFRSLERRVSHFGLLNSLSQTLLSLTTPGIPDTYQGTELWDFSLVDPDNRRPVDYQKRERLLADITTALTANTDRLALAREFIAAKDDGRVKLFVKWAGLTLRRQNPELFHEGDYVPLEVVGSKRLHAFAFMRRYEDRFIIVIIPRFLSRLQAANELPTGENFWGDTRLVLPAAAAGVNLKNHFTDEMISNGERGGVAGAHLKIADALRYFPVALLSSSNLPSSASGPPA